MVLLRCVLLITGEIWSIFGSVIAVVALRKYLPNLRPSTAIIMGSLFVTNSVAGLGSCYFSYWNMKLYYFKISPCLMEMDFAFSLPLQQLPATALYFQASLLCVERYVAIVHPYTYDIWMSVRRVKILLGVSWISVTPLILNYIFGQVRVPCASPYSDVQRFTTVLMIFSSISVIMTITYSKILLVAWKQRNRIANEMVTTIDLTLRGGKGRTDQESNQKKQDFKAAKTVAIVVGSFYVSWLPMMIGRAINLTPLKQSLVNYYLNEIGFMFIYAYVDFAWLVFGASNKEFKEAYQKVLKSLKGR